MARSDVFRHYEESHPWIAFVFDATRIDWVDQFRLGEAMAMVRHLAGAPLKPSVSTEMHLVYLAKGVLATTAIEGNTMTEEEVRARIEGRRVVPGSREYQGVGVDNIVAACNDILNAATTGDGMSLTFEMVCEFNRRILDGQELADSVEAGRMRRHSVAVGPYRGVAVVDCEHLLRRLIDWVATDWGSDASTAEARFGLGILKAIVAHVYLAWIHPFGDGNGRTARLIEFAVLVNLGLPAATCQLLSNHYNLTRDRYYVELQRSSDRGADGIYGFVSYAIAGFVDGLREQVERVRAQQMDVTWTSYVHDVFQARPNTTTQRRRCALVGAMPPDRVVDRREICDLNPEIARFYATKHTKTVTRDVNALVADGLLRRDGGGFIADRCQIESFLPPTSM